MKEREGRREEQRKEERKEGRSTTGKGKKSFGKKLLSYSLT
jgi:hypothetical protein